MVKGGDQALTPYLAITAWVPDCCVVRTCLVGMWNWLPKVNAAQGTCLVFQNDLQCIRYKSTGLIEHISKKLPRLGLSRLFGIP
jgi:hypothetical protein